MCLALVLFSLENTEPAVIRIVNGVQVQAPIAIELILAMGLGAILAWLFSIWTRLQQQLQSLKAKRQIRSKEQQIEKIGARRGTLQGRDRTIRVTSSIRF